VSAAQAQRASFVDDVRRILEETGVAPGMLELEITESVLMENADRAVAQMQQLKALGLRLALDDFGKGYSSLSYLRRFPIDKLKIDQAFIENIATEGNDAALVRAMISMGHHLGMRVVAEGVETAAQSGYLRRSHCDEFQGFFYSPPVSAQAVPELLRRRYLGPAQTAEPAPERTLLLLDDEDNILRALVRLFRRDGYRVLACASAGAAFELLATQPVQVILSDQRMPGISGTEFLSEVKLLYPDTVRMVLSGYTDLASVTDAINRGAIYKFLTKPWDDAELRAQVLEAFRRYERDHEH
jgi:CheY-like chemotaxis protein